MDKKTKETKNYATSQDVEVQAMVIHYYDKPETICGLKFSPQEMEDEKRFGCNKYTYTIKRLNIKITCSELEKINCPECLKELKKLTYHCDNHGFVQGVDVTFNEQCAYCGLNV